MLGAACCREGWVLGDGSGRWKRAFQNLSPCPRAFFQLLCFGSHSPTPCGQITVSEPLLLVGQPAFLCGADPSPAGSTQRGPSPGSLPRDFALGCRAWVLGLSVGWCCHIPLLMWEPLPHLQPWMSDRHPEQYIPHGGGSHKAVILLFPSAMLTAPDLLQKTVSKKEEGQRQRKPLFSMPPNPRPSPQSVPPDWRGESSSWPGLATPDGSLGQGICQHSRGSEQGGLGPAKLFCCRQQTEGGA